MDNRDYNYYEENSASIKLEEITSSEDNAIILRRLRDGDDKLRHLTLGSQGLTKFHIGQGNDLGWLGYFIGKSVKLLSLDIWDFPVYEGVEQQIHAFMDGIARNQSIRKISTSNLGNYGSTAIVRALGSWSQLEELVYGFNMIYGPNGCSALGTLLESGVLKLKKLRIAPLNDIGDDGVASLTNGLKSIGSSLKELELIENSIGNEGLLALMTGLESCTSLERLNLSSNDFSLASAGLGSLSDWLQTAVLNLDELRLSHCAITDEGLQTLAEGAANHSKDLALTGNDSITVSGLKYLSTSLQSDSCLLENLHLGFCAITNEGLQALAEGAASQCKDLDLTGNDSIKASGLKYLSTSLQSESCRLEKLDLSYVGIGDDGAEVLARGLIGNKSLRCLPLHVDVENEDEIAITPAGWSAFSTALCDTSSVNNTYLSNHTIQEFWDDNVEDFDIDDESVVLYLQLNMRYPKYAARCKILMNHTHLDMAPLLRWGLKFLPLAVGWFEGAKTCISLGFFDAGAPDHRRLIVEESEEVFQSRILTALYEFVRGVPKKLLERRNELALVATYDDKIAMMVENENKRIRNEKRRLHDYLEQRDGEITRLEEENKRLRGVVESLRKS